MNNSGGNIVTGFDNFFKNQSNQRRKTEVSDADRVFSNSSVTIQKVRPDSSLGTRADRCSVIGN